MGGNRGRNRDGVLVQEGKQVISVNVFVLVRKVDLHKQGGLQQHIVSNPFLEV